MQYECSRLYLGGALLLRIRERIRFFAYAFGIGLIASLWLFLENRHQSAHAAVWIFVVLVIVTLFGLLIGEYRRYRIAQQIYENRILHIQAALIEEADPDGYHTSLPSRGIDVYISCFGILLDAKVIKFNIDGINLITVELGHRYIYLTYGTRERTRKIRILHGGMDNLDQQKLIEQFIYETGTVPVIVEE
jgi:hypothetical protein